MLAVVAANGSMANSAASDSVAAKRMFPGVQGGLDGARIDVPPIQNRHVPFEHRRNDLGERGLRARGVAGVDLASRATPGIRRHCRRIAQRLRLHDAGQRVVPGRQQWRRQGGRQGRQRTEERDLGIGGGKKVGCRLELLGLGERVARGLIDRQRLHHSQTIPEALD